MRFEDLDFIITVEGELARAPVVVQPFHSTSLDAITEALEELQLHVSEARAPRSDQLLDSTTEGWSISSASSWDPNHPGRTYATSPSHSPMS